MWKHSTITAMLAALAFGPPAAAQEGATVRLAPRQAAATPTLFTTDETFTSRDDVDRSLFGVRADTPMAIPAGRRLNMVLAFRQDHPGRTWRCQVFFSFEPRPGGAYRVTHAHRFERECSAQVIDLSTGAVADSFRLEIPPVIVRGPRRDPVRGSWLRKGFSPLPARRL